MAVMAVRVHVSIRSFCWWLKMVNRRICWFYGKGACQHPFLLLVAENGQ
jgi:hypothetical protein